ncbi:3'(2'),5'-bisphosphate nucleotidase CysQ [Pasteurellaceae bacterium 20609_3]|uniref:3'(2'),5'-bisphosphate nucleotidase CysQ n=1 Tax=Spirabiliibacterium mucosae TaxID=28156 RepID=UPI001AAD0142|nr:3'(2'),5'-bisphosphate nucleotidase CysQ [Spirabiliibacterium mucosae]MBE2898752.1 3'(2'),5'-bisphosphate nucleotidase CysQ [Spirabiliibacterium mucosae]
MQSLNDQLLASVISIAKQAGGMLRAFYQQDLPEQIKADNTPVTAADLAVSEFLCAALSRLTPDVPVLSEENCDIPFAKRRAWAQYWLVDPLDGTQQFLDKTGQFSVLIALVQHNQPRLGVVYSPISDQVVYAMENAGAYRLCGDVLTALSPRPLSAGQKVRLVIGNTSDVARLQPYLQPNAKVEIQRCGSSGIKGVMVATGESECYMRVGKTGEWDTAALECILREMGGDICDLRGQALSYNQRESLINPDFVMRCSASSDWRAVLRFAAD